MMVQLSMRLRVLVCRKEEIQSSRSEKVLLDDPEVLRSVGA
jgi:hypothetical protein